MVVILLHLTSFCDLTDTLTENICSATCTFFPPTRPARRSNAYAQKFGSLTTSIRPSPRTHSRAERSKNGAHVLQAVHRGTRGPWRCSRGALTSTELHHRCRECKLGRRCVSGEQYKFTSDLKLHSEIILHNVGRRTHLTKIAGAHQGKISGLCWADDQRVLSCGADRNIKMWDTRLEAPLDSSGAGPSHVRCLRFHLWLF